MNDRLLTDEDEIFIDEITKRCCGAPWGTVHSEVQYTALHFLTKGKAQDTKSVKARDKEWVQLIDKMIKEIKGAMWKDDWGVKGVIYDNFLDPIVDKYKKALKRGGLEQE